MILYLYLEIWAKVKNSEIKSPLRISASFEMKAKQSKQKLDPFTPTCVIFASGGKRIGLVYKDWPKILDLQTTKGSKRVNTDTVHSF